MFHSSLAAFAALTAVGSALPHTATPGSNIIPNKYIITLRNDISAAEKDSHLAWLTRLRVQSDEFLGVQHTYNMSSYQGYAGSFDQATLDHIMASEDVSGNRTKPFQLV